MIKSLGARDFAAVPYLENSSLMKSHQGKIVFSLKKPNVIVGPNGSGKTALLKTLSLLTLSDMTGQSLLHGDLVKNYDYDACWHQDRWPQKSHFLKNLFVETDDGPALFYRPNHIPGNETSVTHAMMTGYFDEAKAYGALVNAKSSGQQSQALLERLKKVLRKEESVPKLSFSNWGYGAKPRSKKDGYSPDFYYHADALLERFSKVNDDAIPVVLMDEPEQSLDVGAEVRLWKLIEKADTENIQIIVATHSIYPFLHRDSFNLIEAVPGYSGEVTSLLDI